MAASPIELMTPEPALVDRKSFPLTMGLPFAMGALPVSAPLAIEDEAGRPLPLQTRVMETHVDGTVRWLLLDFLADLVAGERSRHMLVAGKERETGGAVIDTREEGSQLIVANGVLKLELDTARCRPLSRVWHNGRLISPTDGAGVDFTVVDEDGRAFSAKNDGAVRFEIEESGPVRLLVRWEGDHKDETGTPHLGFLVRLTVYAGCPFVRLEHVFTNRMDPDEVAVRSIVARVPVDAGDRPAYELADVGDSQQNDCLRTDEPARLEQVAVRQFRILDGAGKVLRNVTPLRAAWSHSKGWADVSGTDRGVLLAAKNFWQNYPKALAVRPDAIDYHLVPELPEKVEHPRADGRDFLGLTGEHSCALGRPFEIPRGMAKTHTFFLQFHGGKEEGRAREDLSRALREWPVPAADSQHYYRAGEFWDYFPYEPKQYPRLETALRNLFYDENLFYKVIREPVRKAFGLKHYGDFLLRFAHDSNDPDAPDAYYLNNEYDTAHVYAMLFLRHREPIQWWAAEACALHTMDVDTCHRAVDMEHMPDIRFMQGCQYRHGYQHVGSIQEVGGKFHTHGHGSHTFLQGVIDYYHLTGDRRARDIAVATGIGLGHMAQFYEWGLERNTGWGLMVMASVYDFEPHEEILAGANAMMDRLYRQLGLTSEGEGDAFAGEAISDRHVNLGTRGLIRWHQVTGDERCRKLILAIMESYVKRGFLEEGLPYAGSTPDSRYPTKSGQGFANLESLAYAYRLTGDRKFVEAGLGALCHAVDWMNNPEFTQTFASRMLRGPFPFLAIAHELGILEKVPGAGAWVKA